MNYVIKIKGIVIKGDGYGKKLGFPTANLAVKPPSEVLPGVYAGVTVLDGKTYRAGILINPDGKVEAHLLGFSGDIYGKMLALEVIKFLREYKKFETEAELIIQIKKDINLC